MIHPNRIVGKRIVAIEQKTIVIQDDGKKVVSFESMTLDDGTVLRPTTTETEYGFYVTQLHENRTAMRRKKEREAP